MKLELRHLRYFVAVAETGSLTVAAERKLHTSQPSLSRQIRDLEEQLGTDLLVRGTRGVALTEAGKVFFERARLILNQIDAAVEAARMAAQPGKARFAVGFLTGQEMSWLPAVMRVLRAELPQIDVVVSSDYSPELAESLVRGKLDIAFMRAEPYYHLEYRTIAHEPLVALVPGDHALAQKSALRAADFLGQSFIAMGQRATVLRGVVDAYFAGEGVAIKPDHVVDNPAMVMSLVASVGGVTVIPAYLQNLLTSSVTSRPLEGKVPTIDLVIGYSRTNASPVLKTFLSRLGELAVDAERAD